jgi:hypothetical protein
MEAFSSICNLRMYIVMATRGALDMVEIVCIILCISLKKIFFRQWAILQHNCGVIIYYFIIPRLECMSVCPLYTTVVWCIYVGSILHLTQRVGLGQTVILLPLFN